MNVMRSSPSPGRTQGDAARAPAMVRNAPAIQPSRRSRAAHGRLARPAYQHALATSAGAGSATVAAGTADAIRTAARMARRIGHTAWNRTSAACAESAAAPRPARPRRVAAPARGTTARLATTPTSDTWLKWLAVIGVTAAWADRLTASAV